MILPSNYVDSLCEVKNMTNHIIARGKIVEIDDESIKIADKDGNMNLVSYNVEVKVNIFNRKHGFRVIIGKVLTSTPNEMKITDIISLVESERRNFFRVDICNPTNMYVADTFIEAKVTEPDEVVINDISLSGLRIETKKELKMDTVVWIEMQIKNRVYFWQCKIMRITFFKELGVYHYGCQFVVDDDESSKGNDALCSYIFQKQREQINNKKDD
ncbi:MAG: PilZ domain-containing protein [Oscillospiraceae bacterium]